MALHFSIKHIQIKRANNRMTFIVAVAVMVSVFCLVSTKSLMSQSSYQRRVLAAKQATAKQLKANVTAAKQLLVQYNVFENNNPNIIGGTGGTDAGSGPQNGDNARIVLDALPSQYDFPALVSSLEKILNNDNVTVEGIGGTDLGQPVQAPDSSGNITPQPMTFSVNATTDYSGTIQLIKDFERSIRPVDITSLTLSGKETSLHLTINATTYYQPPKTFSLGSKEVK